MNDQNKVQIASQDKRIKEKEKKIVVQEEKISDLQELNLKQMNEYSSEIES